ncbi:MAG: hypothetical protein NTV01_05630 [Bacteroidia bacterium]|nr:hypothetical protein [Bacteroidia bacterium]
MTITAGATASITYVGTPFCKTIATGKNVTLTGTGPYTGGTFSATPPGLTIVTGTGTINPSLSNPGTYIVTYFKSATGGCGPVTATTSVTITAAPLATFSYIGTPFCQSASDPSPTLGSGATAGTFTSGSGLVFVSSATGQIDLSASTPATYTVTNTIPASGGCLQVVSTASVTISASPAAPTASVTVQPTCTVYTGTIVITAPLGATYE